MLPLTRWCDRGGVPSEALVPSLLDHRFVGSRFGVLLVVSAGAACDIPEMGAVFRQLLWEQDG